MQRKNEKPLNNDFQGKVDKMIREINRLTVPKSTKDELVHQLELLVSDMNFHIKEAELKGVHNTFENLTKLNYKLTEVPLV